MSSGRSPWVIPSAEKPSSMVTEPRGMAQMHLGGVVSGGPPLFGKEKRQPNTNRPSRDADDTN